jgi:hypothetical protein
LDLPHYSREHNFSSPNDRRSQNDREKTELEQ